VRKAIQFFFVLTILASCKKASENYSIEGRTYDASTGAGLPYVTAVFEQKALTNGVFTDYFLEAARATSDANGAYKMEWKKENLTAAHLLISRDYYYPQEITITPDGLRNNVNLTENISMWPESSVQVAIQNNSAASIIQFNWVGTNFSCNCCTNEVRSFYNIADTVFQCNVYGGKWLKYNCVITSNTGTTFLLDSLYCQPFQTNDLMLNL
jgi:hypothetical protein